MELDIETRTEGDVYIIDVKGEIDLYSSPTMRNTIFTTIKQHHPKILVVVLRNVTYTDSSGIATLVEGLQLAEKYQAKFKLVGLSPAVLEVFQLARLERIFEMYATEEEAMESD